MSDIPKTKESLHRRFEADTIYVDVTNDIRPAMQYLRYLGGFGPVREEMSESAMIHDRTIWFHVVYQGRFYIPENHWKTICEAIDEAFGGANKLREGNLNLYEITRPRERDTITGIEARRAAEEMFWRACASVE